MKTGIWNLLAPRKRKFALWSAGLLLLYTLLGFMVLPPVIRVVAVKQLSKQLDRDVSIRQVRLNPFALSTTIRGLLIKDKNGEPFISWDEVYVNLQLSSFFSHPWVFKEIRVIKPFVHAQMNKDGTFNFSDLVAKFSNNAAPAKTESKPLVFHIGRLRVVGATAAIADLTPREPFRRTLGPLDVTFDDFRTDPDSDNPYAFTGTTDAGGQISWSGLLCLSPLRSQGEFKLFNFTVNKFAPLYQDLVRFEIRSGTIALKAKYQFDLGPTNRVATLHDTAFGLRNFKLGAPGETNDIAELHALTVTGLNTDIERRQASMNSVILNGANLAMKRTRDNSVNVVEIAKPAESFTNAPGGILFLLRSVTNAVALLLNSTNQWSGTVRSVTVTNCALHLEDDVNSRPARLELSDITLEAKNISNVPGTNLTAELSLRWNKDGSIKTVTTASFLPPTADIQLDFDQLNLNTLDPYLEPKLNLYIQGSKVGLHGIVSLRTPKDELPQVTFHGDASLDDFHTVDGVMAEDLVKWDSIAFHGIDANLNPQTVSIREIDVDGAYARLIIETNKTLNILNALRMTDANASASNETQVAITVATHSTTTNLPLPQISIGAIVITNTAVSFTDRSLQPNVNATIQSANGTIAGLSTEQLRHADIALNALIDGVGPASITGTINPFSGTMTNEIKVSVKNMDLTPESPYSGKFAGYRIAEGALNLDLAYELLGKRLQSKNVITLDRFTFGEKVNSPDATHLPVRLAVAILKDRDGKIVLDVPVEGRLDDPKFRIRKVIERAIVNILEKAATSPFSLLGALFGGGGEELGYQDFTPGSAGLLPAETNKLNLLVKALYARPGLNLEISGSVESVADRGGLQRAALERQLRVQKWQSLPQTERDTVTADQVTLTPQEHAGLVKKLFDGAQAAGKITPELIAANTNLAIAAQLIKSSQSEVQKGATMLTSHAPSAAPATPGAAPPALAASTVPPTLDPMEALLLTTFPVTDADLATLAADRAKAVRAYFLQSGKVEAARLFITENQTGGVRSDGSRVYLQLR